MSKRIDSVTYELIRDDAAVTEEECRRLVGWHYRQVEIFVPEVGKSVPLETPICARCAEPWGRWGCSTLRLLALASIEKDARVAAEERVAALTRTLADISSRGGINQIPSTRTMKLWAEIHELGIHAGGMDVVDQVLMKMRRGAEAEVKAMHGKRIITDLNHKLNQ